MNRILTPILCMLALGGCVVHSQPPRVAVAQPAPVVVRGPDRDCHRQRQEAQRAQQYANREVQEARYYGGRREVRDADRAQAEANQQRAQAIRACD